MFAVVRTIAAFCAVVIAILLLCAGALRAQCSGPSLAHAHLQWSEPATVLAPDRSWAVEVHPVLNADANRTAVTVRKCGASKSEQLFTLERDADLYWSADSKHVLVVNEPVSGTNALLLFSVPDVVAGMQKPSPDALNKKVNALLAQRLGRNRRVQFCLPTFVSWKADSLLLAVGGQTFTQDVGPLDEYCFGLRVDSETQHIDKVLSTSELETSAGHACQISP